MESENKYFQTEIQLVVFKIGEEEFGVDINQVREIVRLVPITPVPRAPEFIEGVVNLRGNILAVVDLAKRLNLKSKQRSDQTRIIVIELEDKNLVGVIVDEVTEVLRLPTQNIDNTPELITSEVEQKYLNGVGKLGERLLILIDLVKVFSHEEIEELKSSTSKKVEDSENNKEEGIDNGE